MTTKRPKAKMGNRPSVPEIRERVRSLAANGNPYTDGVIEALEWAVNGENFDSLERLFRGEVTDVLPAPVLPAPAPAPVEAPVPVPVSDSPLAHLIPVGKFGSGYINRKVAGSVLDFDVLDAARRTKKNVLIEGPTGSAKTSLVFAYAARESLPIVTVACNGAVDLRALLGGWVPSTGGEFTYAAGDIFEVVRHGGILYLDEVNFLPPKIAAVLYGLLDGRRTLYLPEAAGSEVPTVVEAHEDFFVVASLNPGYLGTRPLNPAFRNRFTVKLDWGYNDEVEAKLIKSASLRELAVRLRERVTAGDLTTPVPTNVLMDFEEIVGELGFEFAAENFTNNFDVTERPVVVEVLAIYRDRIVSELAGDPVSGANSGPAF